MKQLKSFSTFVILSLIFALHNPINAQEENSIYDYSSLSADRRLELTELYKTIMLGDQKNFDENKNKKKAQTPLSIKDKFYLINLEANDLVIDTLESPKAVGIAYSDSIKQSMLRCATFDSGSRFDRKIFMQKSLYVSSIYPMPHEVEIVFTVIKASKGELDIPEVTLQEQINVLNEAFSPIDIEFKIGKIVTVVNPEYYQAWWNPYDPTLQERYLNMCHSVLNPPIDFVNVIVNGAGVYGVTTFPWEETYRTQYDNILINRNTLPGVMFGGTKMMGKTLIHEMGHFFGLWHTFHASNPNNLNCDDSAYNGCELYGDRIEDTPYQRYCHFYGCGECESETNLGCDECIQPKLCDTCPARTGLDPLNNFMGYNPDACMNRFTPGQYERLKLIFMAERLYLSKSNPFIADK